MGSKIICFGGICDQKVVADVGLYYTPISKDDQRDSSHLPTCERIKLIDQGKYHKISTLLDRLDIRLYFYVWNNDETLFNELLSKYMRENF